MRPTRRVVSFLIVTMLINFTLLFSGSHGARTRASSFAANRVATDINAHATDGLQYFPLPHPIRLLDTRPGESACNAPGVPLGQGATRTQVAVGFCDGVTIPPVARAIVGNATIVNDAQGGNGFLTLFPSDQPRPNTFNLSYQTGQVIPDAFTARLSPDGSFNIYATTQTHFILDVTGYYAPPATGGLYYHPLPHPVRLLDTRAGRPACDSPGVPLQADGVKTESARVTCDGLVIPPATQAIVGNATIINDAQGGQGFVTIYPSGSFRPLASNLNYVPGQVIPNAFTVALGPDGAFNIYSLKSLHIIADVSGYYSPEPLDANGTGMLFTPLASPVRLFDTRPDASACDAPGVPLVIGRVRAVQASDACAGTLIPPTAESIVGTATAVSTVGSNSGGYVTLFSSDASLPPVSNLNFMLGQTISNSFTTRLGTDGAFKIYAVASLHFIVDLAGYFSVNSARYHTIGGRILAGGNPLAGIGVNLDSPAMLSTFTDARGYYVFRVPPGKDYTITPSEQNFYAFTPQSRSFNSLDSDQTADFNAALTTAADQPYVLEFDGAAKTVDYGPYFEPNLNHGHFFWEFWAAPGANASGTYLVSDGYGGAHALLFGFAYYGESEQSHYQLFGDIWDGTNITYFGSDEGPVVGEWGHYALGWDGREIVIYFDGVPVGRTTFAGPRRSPDFTSGGGRLLVGGSDHSNLVGKIAQVRGFEWNNPREGMGGIGGSSTLSAFAPETLFRSGGNLLSNFFTPADPVADTSVGLYGSRHAARLRGTPYPFGLLTFCEECPRPQYVLDSTAPNFFAGMAAASPVETRSPQPPTAPDIPQPDLLVLDTFARAHSTYTFGGVGGLGSTESGNVGPLPWLNADGPASPHAFGILNGRAVPLADDTNITWVAIPSNDGNLDVRVERHPGKWGAGLDTGLSFRVADARNFFFAYTSGTDNFFSPRTLNVGYYRAGTRTNLIKNIAMPFTWTALRAVTNSDGKVSIYADSQLITAFGSDVLATSTGAGLYHDRKGLGLKNRWDNFIVYAGQ
ncbi:MAG: LamG-like jellyroll fold domain-containing protein [Pyrinomonadaceae bacterium]